jgi:DNA-binding XRE family transcriptional regulator
MPTLQNLIVGELTMDDLLKTFCQTIKTARQAAGLTQEKLAEHVGITTRYIIAIENESKHPCMKVLIKIIRALKRKTPSLL